MGLDEFEDATKRRVWENKNGARVMTVSSFLKPGTYKVKEAEKDNGVTVLECKPVEDD